MPSQFWRARPPKSQATQRELSVFVVAYRNPTLLRECLGSIEANLGKVDVRVWDNSGSRSPEMDEVIATHPEMTWYLGSPNIGFAAAVNALARKVPDRNMLLLNPDAVLQGPLSGTLAALRKPGVAATAPLVADGSAERNQSRPWDVAHREQTLARVLVTKSGYSQRIRGHRWSDLYRTQPATVDGYLTGACLAISRDAWEAVGPFDEEFFLYGEEDDWQRRARDAGWSLQLIDEPGIAHTSQGTVANDSRATIRSRDLIRANVALNLELHAGAASADLYLAGTSLLDRIQRSARRDRAARRRPRGSHPSSIITTNRLDSGDPERGIVSLAGELDSRGYEVVIACTRRFGRFRADIPTSIRVVRQPWWAPAVDVGTGPSVIISGDTSTEMAFATVWRAIGRRRRWLVAARTPPSAEIPPHNRLLAAAIRRPDGLVILSDDDAPAITRRNPERKVFVAFPEVELIADAYERAIAAVLE